jgi:hypothetical protein
MGARKPKPAYLRIVGRDERAPAYFIRQPGIQPRELWDFEARLPGSGVAMLEYWRRRFGDSIAEQRLARIARTYVKRSGQTFFVAPCLAAEPNLPSMLLTLCAAVLAEDVGCSLADAERCVRRRLSGKKSTSRGHQSILSALLPDSRSGMVLMLLTVPIDRDALRKEMHELGYRPGRATVGRQSQSGPMN